MFDIAKLNKEVQELGPNNIAWIVESNDGEEWNCYVDPEIQGYLFKFNPDTYTFDKSICQYYDRYEIRPSVYKGLYDIVLIGDGVGSSPYCPSPSCSCSSYSVA